MDDFTDVEPYLTMAEVYDRWMEHDSVPYDKWSEFVMEAFRQYGRNAVASVIDIGCGTGQLLLRLRNAGMDVTGVDASEVMLRRARERLGPGAALAKLRLPDAALIDLGKFDCATACFDVLNYLVEPGALVSALQQISSVLNSGGVFVFDLNTRYKLESIFANYNTGDDVEDFAYIWRNRYDTQSGVSTFLVTFFVRLDSGLFARTAETHRERWFDAESVARTVANSGLIVVGHTDAYTAEPVSAATLRETWVAVKG